VAADVAERGESLAVPVAVVVLGVAASFAVEVEKEAELDERAIDRAPIPAAQRLPPDCPITGHSGDGLVRAPAPPAVFTKT
jgi:hypothetical protein